MAASLYSLPSFSRAPVPGFKMSHPLSLVNLTPGLSAYTNPTSSELSITKPVGRQHKAVSYNIYHFSGRLIKPRSATLLARQKLYLC
ncbi:MAG TPA: hypothetical protein VK543_01955 [Puia sp.]|nr:hypothetical protein [Puia sp.]